MIPVVRVCRTKIDRRDIKTPQPLATFHSLLPLSTVLVLVQHGLARPMRRVVSQGIDQSVTGSPGSTYRFQVLNDGLLSLTRSDSPTLHGDDPNEGDVAFSATSTLMGDAEE